MKTILSSEIMDIPEGVEIKVKAKVIEVKGPRGTLTRNFKHLNLDFQLITDEETGKQKLKVDAWFGSRKTTAAIRTALSHVNNLINGVTQGFRYKMRFVYAHFPINASITNGNTAIEIRNFLGEKKVNTFPLFVVFVTLIFEVTFHCCSVNHASVCSSCIYVDSSVYCLLHTHLQSIVFASYLQFADTLSVYFI